MFLTVFKKIINLHITKVFTESFKMHKLNTALTKNRDKNHPKRMYLNTLKIFDESNYYTY